MVVPENSAVRRILRTAACSFSGFWPWVQIMMSALSRIAETS